MIWASGSRRAVVLAAAGIVVLGTILVLRMGSAESGDARFTAGGKLEAPPKGSEQVVSLTDIIDAGVYRTGSQLVFSAQMSAEVPSRLNDAAVDWQWQLTGRGGDRWIVSANLNVALNAALVAQDGSHDSTTIDGSLPGKVGIDGDLVVVFIDPSGVEEFPSTFTWMLTAVAVTDRAEPVAGRVEDRFPDEGSIEFEDARA